MNSPFKIVTDMLRKKEREKEPESSSHQRLGDEFMTNPFKPVTNALKKGESQAALDIKG